jgi:hypothetical protein
MDDIGRASASTALCKCWGVIVEVDELDAKEATDEGG